MRSRHREVEGGEKAWEWPAHRRTVQQYGAKNYPDSLLADATGVDVFEQVEARVNSPRADRQASVSSGRTGMLDHLGEAVLTPLHFRAQ